MFCRALLVACSLQYNQSRWQSLLSAVACFKIKFDFILCLFKTVTFNFCLILQKQLFPVLVSVWPPCIVDTDIILCSCSFFFLSSFHPSNSALTLLVGWQEGHLACKKWGGWWRWALVSPDGVTLSRMVGVSASVNLPLHHKVQKSSSGTGSPGWSRKKGRKTFVVVVVLLLLSFFISPVLSGHILDVYHTSTHDVALVQI